MNTEEFATNAGKMRSLMQRMDNRMTLTEAEENEKANIEESTKLGLPNMEAVLTMGAIKNGSLAAIGYIQLYPCSGQYPSQELYDKMHGLNSEFDNLTDRARSHYNDYMDQTKNTEWVKPEGRGTKLGKPFKNKLYPYILKLTTYRVNWQDRDAVGRAEQADKDRMSAIIAMAKPEWRDKYGLSQDSDQNIGPKRRNGSSYKYVGDLAAYNIATNTVADDNGVAVPVKGRYLTDPNDPNSAVEYDKNAIKNVMSDVTAQRPAYFGVYEDGHIDEIPKSLGQILYHVGSSKEAEIASIQDPQEKAWAEEYFAEKKHSEMSHKQWILNNVAYICATATSFGSGKKDSVYWVNQNPLFLLKKTVNKQKIEYQFNIDNEELKNVLARFAKSEAEELEALANQNI